MHIPCSIRRPLARWRRSIWEACGSTRFSRPALHELDRKLERYLNFDGGFFIEAGANDGYQQSNTYYFEKVRGWNGILIEPIPALARECRKNRRVRVIEAALSDTEAPGATIRLKFAGLMSIAADARDSVVAVDDHVTRGLALQKLSSTYEVDAPARTLSSIIDECNVVCDIDFLSLDIEGAETAALRGLDLSRHAPRFICVEARQRSSIADLLNRRYSEVAVLHACTEYADILYARK